MIFKDAIILSFFLDREDPGELEALEHFKKDLDRSLRAAGLGRYDGEDYNAKVESFTIDLAGNNAEAMLQAIRPLVRQAHFLIGPRATLIMRGFGQGSGASIRHVDL